MAWAVPSGAPYPGNSAGQTSETSDPSNPFICHLWYEQFFLKKIAVGQPVALESNRPVGSESDQLLTSRV